MRTPFLTSILAIGTLAISTSSFAATNFNLCGASPSGLWQLLGTGLDRAVNTADPGSSITYQTSSGGFANIMQIQTQACDLAIVHGGEAMIANAGRPPFDAPINNFSAIGLLYNWAPMQWVMNADFAEQYNITSLEDLVEQTPPLRLVLNRRGILPSMVGESSLEELDITPELIESWGGSVVYQGSSVAAELIQNRRADMWANQEFEGSSAISSMSESVPMTLLNVPNDVINSMGEMYGDTPHVIESNAYPWLEEAIQTHTASAMLIAPNDLDETKAYELTKAIIENLHHLQEIHPAMSALSQNILINQSTIDFHPGALRAYQEAGLL